VTAESRSPRRQRQKQPDPKYMTFVEHLSELRQRLIISFLSIGVGSVVGWLLASRILEIMARPLQQRMHIKHLYFTAVYGAFTLQLKIAIMVGFIIALPVTTYQLWGFVAPAFGPRANRWAPLWISSAIVLFTAGGVTGYFVIPLALGFFNSFTGPNIQPLITANEYLGFFALILAVFGVSFELPLALVSLSAAGITSSKWLAAKRLHFLFGIFVFSTLITPGADLISPLILGAIMYALFEVSIVVSRLIGK
jgi:sec-independent protein translocase protein TatC